MQLEGAIVLRASRSWVGLRVPFDFARFILLEILHKDILAAELFSLM